MSSLADKLARAREVAAKAKDGSMLPAVLMTPRCKGDDPQIRSEHGWHYATHDGNVLGIDEGVAPLIVLAVNALPALLDVAEALLALRGEYVGVEDMLPYETSVHVQAIDAALARLSEVL